MGTEYVNRNLRKASFKEDILNNSVFAGSDLRGADFSGADLSGADLTRVRTGITPLNTILLFIGALIVSGVSGYFAMLAGETLQRMFASNDLLVKASSIIALIFIFFFIAFAIWRGGGKTIRYLIIPSIILALLAGIIGYFTKAGTGMGGLYLAISFVLVTIMFITGTAARAAAGSLSNVIFIVVALMGGLIGKNLGGGIGTVVMAISCAVISKRALSGAKGFGALRKLISFITQKLGTSFRGAKLDDTHFSKSVLRNADFTNADISHTDWGDSKKINCLT